MHLLDLNHDVLSTIVHSLSTDDAFNLSATARAIHSLAMQRALSEVYLWCPEQTSGFCTYMLADIDGRLHWLQRLEIPGEAFNVYNHNEETFAEEGDFSSATALADVLGRARNLRHLSLSCTNYLLQIEPRIGDAVAALQELASLELNDVGAPALGMMSRLRSSPRELVLFLSPPDRNGQVSPFDLIARLENLRSLSVSWLRNTNLQLPRGRGARAKWPTLHTLSLAMSSGRLHPFVDAFPGVRVLTLRNTSMLEVDYLGTPMYDPTGTMCWPRLDHVHANLYLGCPLTCPVRWLELESPLKPASVHALQSMSPVRLSFDARLSFDMGGRIDDGLWTALAQDAPRLRYLDVMMQDPIIHTKLLPWMERALEMLKPLRIVCLRLCLLDVPYGIMPNPGKLSDALIRRKFTSLFVRIPSVRYIAVGFGDRTLNHHVPMRCGTFDGEISWWRVTGAGEDRRAEPLSLNDGRRLGEYVHSADFDAMEALDETILHDRHRIESCPI
ncbi:hypothetical protein B0H21DRAFT_749583 [Amylocystis lapponica]|nr:hypothetical protein B0H21DRAFT_749583 [Amylocystis lapponica]